MEYYFGATGGGLWKTTDGGLTWRPVTDGQLHSSSVGAVAVSESNPDVVYIGMGETELRGNIMQGDGVYKSTDAGKTWKHIGPRRHAGHLAHPHSSHQSRHRLRVGARAIPTARTRSAASSARRTAAPPGRRCSTATTTPAPWTWPWTRTTRNVLFAAIWDANRTPWSLTSGGPSSGLFKSTDGGDHWTEITRNPGLPPGIIGKIGVAVSGADSNRVYAIVENENGGVFVSDDAGATWKKVSEDRTPPPARLLLHAASTPTPRPRTRCTSSTRASTSPPTAARPTGSFARRTATITICGSIPTNPLRMIEQQRWRRQRLDQRRPDVDRPAVCHRAALPRGRDQATFPITFAARSRTAPPSACRARRPAGAAVAAAADAARRQLTAWAAARAATSRPIPPIPTSSTPAARARCSRASTAAPATRATSRSTRCSSPANRPARCPSAGSGPSPSSFRRVNPDILYTSSQHLWKTTDDGHSWQKISPDLTRADPKTLGDSGGPITHDQNGPEIYGTIFTIAPSRKEADTIWTGSDDGLVYITRDGGKNWTKITPPGMPDFGRVSLIDASPQQSRRRLRGGEELPERRPQALHLQDRRLRQDLDQDRQRHSRRRFRARRARRSGHAGPALRRHRARHLRFVRRRRAVAIASR